MTRSDRLTAGPPDEVQPWLFRVADTAIDMLVDRSRRLDVLNPDGREMLVSVGAAVFNLRVALGAAGTGRRCCVCRARVRPMRMSPHA